MSKTWENEVASLHGALQSHARRRGAVANDADDIAQESLLRAFHLIDGKDRIGNFRAYLYRIAGNLAVDTLRHRNVRERISGTALDAPESLAVASPEPSAEQALMAAQRKAAFDAALAQLPERQRQALVLNRIEGWPYARIADHLGCSPATAFNDVKAAMQFIMARTRHLDL